MPADRATLLKCDNAGHWSIVGVTITSCLSKPADELWLKGYYISSGTYTADWLFKREIFAHMIRWENFSENIFSKLCEKDKWEEKKNRL